MSQSTDRQERVLKRRRLFDMNIENVGDEVQISTNENDGVDLETIEEERFASQHVQCELISDSDTRMSVKKFDNNPDAINFYTGFDDYEHFKFVFNVLGPAVDHLNSCNDCKLEPVDQFFVTLIKLRLAKEDLELSFMFNISPRTVGSIFNTWVKFMYYQFKEIDIWPSKENVLQYMPKNFGRQFMSTRVILDATEVPIMKPSNVTSQSATFSTYKNKNTLKTMIGITPKGLVSYISDSYGGSSSDRQIIERSPLVTEKGKYFEGGDSIMSDRGIRIQDMFDTFNIKVNTPHMLEGKSQLNPEDVIFDRRVASKRIHVERVIGLAKTYKILVCPLNQSKKQMGSFIIYVCFLLANFRRSIV
ncbi:PREDICTED: uncharacterized protein LOC106814989, partial [Priapulus caudatus]|uniref:Uncharacterized protein LOC106814989 n=1 Tax=Priapulus caudatus TaxID=37621 RepID=A0ABM1ERQ5_PRICU